MALKNELMRFCLGIKCKNLFVFDVMFLSFSDIFGRAYRVWPSTPYLPPHIK